MIQGVDSVLQENEMKLTIDIPKEFVRDFTDNKFEDCFRRLIADTRDRLNNKNTLLVGNYEIETCEMLIEAFSNAESEK